MFSTRGSMALAIGEHGHVLDTGGKCLHPAHREASDGVLLVPCLDDRYDSHSLTI